MNIHQYVQHRRDASNEECDDCDDASQKASMFTKKANKSGSQDDHKVAAAAHGLARSLHEVVGNKDEAKHHAKMEEGHRSSRYAENPFAIGG